MYVHTYTHIHRMSYSRILVPSLLCFRLLKTVISCVLLNINIVGDQLVFMFYYFGI